ncbi:MAG: CoA transferase [Xanthobacteraceae bacterium]
MPSPESIATPLPLAGIRVLEFCHTIMGPSAGLILADLGADVIKIEPANGAIPRGAASASPPVSLPPSTATSAASPSI